MAEAPASSEQYLLLTSTFPSFLFATFLLLLFWAFPFLATAMSQHKRPRSPSSPIDLTAGAQDLKRVKTQPLDFGDRCNQLQELFPDSPLSLLEEALGQSDYSVEGAIDKVMELEQRREREKKTTAAEKKDHDVFRPPKVDQHLHDDPRKPYGQ